MMPNNKAKEVVEMSIDSAKKSLKQKVAFLEFANDQLMSEIHYVDDLLRLIGFPEGLSTVKLAAKEVLEKDEEAMKGPDDLAS
jgi:hypothetical protein